MENGRLGHGTAHFFLLAPSERSMSRRPKSVPEVPFAGSATALSNLGRRNPHSLI